jgi:very-short-patch-repair endonuclease
VAASRQVPLQEVTCATCGRVFRVNRARIGHARFCSLACRYASQSNRIPCACKICGKTVLRKPCQVTMYKNTYCSPACYAADPDLRTRLIAQNRRQQHLYPNRLEQAGYALLDALEIEYQPQHLLAERYCVDAFVPAANLIIQWAGDYWHGNPAVFPTFDARQRRRRWLDKVQDEHLTRIGYRILRIWESDFWRDPIAVAGRIQAALVAA